LTFAVPGVMPAAHAANANLFVSAENSQFDNYMSGPQVIEVVVIDSDINDTDEAKGEPDVTVNGKILRMVQAVDGNWYGYFADRDMALIADYTNTLDNTQVGAGLDFGTFCSAGSGESVLGFDTGDTDGIAVAISGNTTGTGNGTNGDSDGGAINTTCTSAELVAKVGSQFSSNNSTSMNVIREQKDKYFLSSEQTGNGSAQSVAHGLKHTPQVVKIIVTDESASDFVITEGTHTATNVVVTVTSGVKYKVYGEI
jgi:hypothetical protein